MATWFNRLSKLPGCSDVVIITTITYGLETQHNMYPLKQFPDLNL
jgi:hypothetical protein